VDFATEVVALLGILPFLEPSELARGHMKDSRRLDGEIAESPACGTARAGTGRAARVT